jgi:DNA polymerase III alpha subunit
MTYQNLTESSLCDLLYTNPELDLNKVTILDPNNYNNAVKNLAVDYPLLKQTLQDAEIDDIFLQSQWFIPREYRQFNLVEWLFDKCLTDQARDRVEQELRLFVELEAYDLLLYLKYLVDTMIDNNIVWGVGRGSSVSSYVLYLIGVHHIDSLRYNLDVREFLKETT